MLTTFVVLADFHHSALFHSLKLLSERNGWNLARPVGMEWYKRGLWQGEWKPETASQFLEDVLPSDGTPGLNTEVSELALVKDPHGGTHRVVTWDDAISTVPDLLICTHPANLGFWRKFRDQYASSAPLLFQIGNYWPTNVPTGYQGVLASVERDYFSSTRVCYYRQEFEVPQPESTPSADKKVASYVHVLHEKQGDYRDFNRLANEFSLRGVEVRSYGGQNKDGVIPGDQVIASMRTCMAVIHLKEGGDGYGHTLHQAYAAGRPPIVRRRQYNRQLGDRLLSVPGTCFDLDQMSIVEVVDTVLNRWQEMGLACREAFDKEVDFAQDAERVAEFISRM